MTTTFEWNEFWAPYMPEGSHGCHCEPEGNWLLLAFPDGGWSVAELAPTMTQEELDAEKKKAPSGAGVFDPKKEITSAVGTATSLSVAQEHCVAVYTALRELRERLKRN